MARHVWLAICIAVYLPGIWSKQSKNWRIMNIKLNLLKSNFDNEIPRLTLEIMDLRTELELERARTDDLERTLNDTKYDSGDSTDATNDATELHKQLKVQSVRIDELERSMDNLQQANVALVTGIDTYRIASTQTRTNAETLATHNARLIAISANVTYTSNELSTLTDHLTSKNAVEDNSKTAVKVMENFAKSIKLAFKSEKLRLRNITDALNLKSNDVQQETVRNMNKTIQAIMKVADDNTIIIGHVKELANSTRAKLTDLQLAVDADKLRPCCLSDSDDRTCKPEEFDCGDNVCVPQARVCDGHVDCDSDKDEQACANPVSDDRTCKPDEFDCGDIVCVPQARVCDGHVDCDSGKDEQACANPVSDDRTCKPDEFDCGDNVCVPQARVCDGHVDCDSGKDEQACANPVSAQCRDSLGMQSGEIPDSAITASSSYDDGMVGPENARIRTETNGGAWCPKNSITRESYEYLQTDLGRLTVITMVEVQGRFGNGQGQEFADEFRLEYQREDGGEWMRFRNKRGEERFLGNSNTYSAELRRVRPPIIAKRIRFIPTCQQPRTVCMRVEIYGCRWEGPVTGNYTEEKPLPNSSPPTTPATGIDPVLVIQEFDVETDGAKIDMGIDHRQDGVVSYKIKQGDKYGADVDFHDVTYDGIINGNVLHEGLGQLTDGETGETNFLLDSQSLGMKGYEWVGWKNDSTLADPGPVTITFKFDSVRKFTSVIINCNNYFSKGVRVFRQAAIYYSIGGKYFKLKKDKFYFIRDTVFEYARQVLIRLNHIKAKYIKIQLYYDSTWILISEVAFSSSKLISGSE